MIIKKTIAAFLALLGAAPFLSAASRSTKASSCPSEEK